MTHPNHGHDDHHLSDIASPETPAHELVEPDLSPSFKLFGLIIALLIIVAATFIAGWRLLVAETTVGQYVKQVNVPNTEITELRSEWAAKLGDTAYAQVDAAKGTYRIPVSVAMQKLVANPELLKPITPAQPFVVDPSVPGARAALLPATPTAQATATEATPTAPAKK